MRDVSIYYKAEDFPATCVDEEKNRDNDVLVFKTFFDCPLCGGELIPLIPFGKETMHKCRDCGIVVVK